MMALRKSLEDNYEQARQKYYDLTEELKHITDKLNKGVDIYMLMIKNKSQHDKKNSLALYIYGVHSYIKLLRNEYNILDQRVKTMKNILDDLTFHLESLDNSINEEWYI